MLFLNTFYHHIYRTFAVLCLALLLTGCPSLPQSSITDDASLSSDYYLNKADQNSGATKIDYQILAARALLREGNTPHAERLLNSLPKELTTNQLKEGFLLAAEIELAKRNPQNAQIALNKLIVEQLNPTQQIRYYQSQIQATNRNDALTQLRAYVMLETLVVDAAKQQIIDNSWDLLSSLSVNTLDRMIINANENTLRGWLDLARIYATNRDDSSRLQNEIRSWQTRYPQNPYNHMLPTRLSGVSQFAAINVSNVALLLPLGGQTQVFSDAIQAGFKAAMEESHASHVNLTIYDTTQQSIPDLLRQLEQTHTPTVVVGPLLKNDVNETVNSNTTLTVLTLNTPDNLHNITNMCYFSLSPEDEAREAAIYMQSNEHGLPLLIVPRTDLGQRMVKAFDEQWMKQNGTSVLVRYFDNANDLKESINNRSGMRLTGSPASTGALASGDVDAVYIVANQEELSLIKAMLDMEVSNRMNLKSIYASSRSNHSSTGPDFRLEMEGIRFSDIPLLAGANSRIYQTAMQMFNGDHSQMRLYAFGMDAWKLINALAEVRQLPDYQIRGYTGTLVADNQCVINRRLSWLEYRQGNIVAAQ